MLLRKDSKLGWQKDRYRPQDNPTKHVIKLNLNTVPASSGLLSFAPDVRDQGNVGSCTGFGFGGIITGLAKQLNVFTEWFSPTWIYNGARYIEGTLNEDAGAQTGDCSDWLLHKGGLLEHFWPYNPNALDPSTPPSSDDSYAAQWPILTSIRVAGGSLGIIDALAAGNFVTVGVPWPESWMNTDANGILSPITAKSILAGGHEVFIIDYDLTQNLFLCQNSWGTGWGKAGRFYMPMAPFDGIFQSLGGYDAFYMTAKWGTPTPTPPPPTPPPPTPPPAPTLVSLSISPMPASLLVGASLQLTASGKYSDGSVKNLTTQVAWKANNNLVTINASGFVMGVTPGTSTITATLGLIIGGDLVTVIAPTPTPPPPTPPPPSTSNFVRLLESADGKNWNFVFQRNVPSTAQFMLESSPDGKNWNILYQGEIKVKHEEEKK